MSNRYPGGVVRKNQLVPTTSSASGMWTMDQSAQATKSDIWPYANIAMPISQSLRFRASNTNYLTRTYGAPTNNKVWTWSAWVKRGSLSLADANHLFMASPTDVSGNPSTYGRLVFETDGTLRYQSALSSVATESFTSSAVYRDPSAWYHIVLYMDAVNTTVRGYVNGTEITYASRTNPTNTNTAINGSGNYHRIGLFRSAELRPFDGYMADVNFIDGQALDPSYFGQTSAITGVWEPKQYSGTYGTNGWHLEFKDTTVGQDTSGNNNDWTPNNFSTANDYTNDLVKDVPTQWAPRDGTTPRGNYCVLNAVDQKGTFLAGGNLIYGSTSPAGSGAGNNIGIRSSIGVTTGKWYVEFTKLATTTNGQTPKVGTNDIVLGSYNGYLALTTGGNALPNSNSIDMGYDYEQRVGVKIGSTGTSQSATGISFTTNDVLAYALDCDSKTLIVYKNGSQIGSTISWSETTPGTALHFFFSQTSSWDGPCWAANFGQQPFKYTIPSGYKQICTTNLPAPTIGATVSTAANKYFDATLITATAATQVITNVGGFQPDFVWLKSRTNANNPTIYDAIRGVNTILYPALTNAEAVGSAQLTAFNSNGFTLGASENANDQNGEASVGWQWNAGGSTVTNTSGTISSQVRANPTAGFSIVTYTGTGANATVGHGLGVAPSMVIVKSRVNAYDWVVYNSSIGNTKKLYLNLTSAEVVDSTAWNNTSPTSSTFSLGSNVGVNQSSSTYVAYCWTPIAGYSAFGNYTGNGSTDGPFVYTGFRPKWLFVKKSSGTSYWQCLDTSRSPYNLAGEDLIFDLADAEKTIAGGFNQVDILSNGFKIRNTNCNDSGGTYIFGAFAEAPFKNAIAR